ncbi:MAG: hypothetical protein V7K41_20250 [Nostoc sp.]|uniref:hypothetical protein n=1 Tax=Nostoc sp. TaxID=1180 RepID=UPI002FF99B30
MESQTSQPTVIDSQTLDLLKDEIKQEISERLKNSNLNKLLEKHGILKDDIQVKCDIDLTKIQIRDTNPSLLMPGKRVEVWVCLCKGEMTDCPCPKP